VHIVVEDIPARGRHVRFSRSDAWAALAAASALDGDVAELSGLLHLTRGRRQEVRVKAEAHAVAQRVCDRCGQPTQLTVDADEELAYLPLVPPARAANAKPDEVELAEEDLDVGWYEGGVVDLETVVSELLALAAPMRVTCVDAVRCDEQWQRALGDGSSPKGEPDGSPAEGDRPANAFAVLKDMF
jgi:uncharacterized metal-binding protein YceD (DUF177 family)